MFAGHLTVISQIGLAIGFQEGGASCLGSKKQHTKRPHKAFTIVLRRFTSSLDESSLDSNDMESPSDNDSYHTGEESSDDGDDSSEQITPVLTVIVMMAMEIMHP